jgi:hypothetical protein
MDTAEVGALAIVLKDAGPAAADMVKRILGPMCDELGQLGGEWIKSYRLSRIASVLGKAVKGLKEAGIDAKSVRPGVLFPILEGASWEDDENLHTKWANLLANAARDGGTRPAFIETLKQLTPFEAGILDRFYKMITEDKLGPISPSGECPLVNANAFFGRMDSFPDLKERNSMESAVDNFERLGLVRREYEVNGGPDLAHRVYESLMNSKDYKWNDPPKPKAVFTRFAMEFMKACRAPQLKEEPEK